MIKADFRHSEIRLSDSKSSLQNHLTYIPRWFLQKNDVVNVLHRIIVLSNSWSTNNTKMNSMINKITILGNLKRTSWANYDCPKKPSWNQFFRLTAIRSSVNDNKYFLIHISWTVRLPEIKIENQEQRLSSLKLHNSNFSNNFKKHRCVVEKLLHLFPKKIWNFE